MVVFTFHLHFIYISFTTGSETNTPSNTNTVLNFVSIYLPQWTPLHIAVKEFQVRTVKFLVENGADMSSKNKEGVNTYMRLNIDDELLVV